MTSETESALVSLLVWPGSIAEVSARIGEGWSQTRDVLDGMASAGWIVRLVPDGVGPSDRWHLTDEGRALATVAEVMAS